MSIHAKMTSGVVGPSIIPLFLSPVVEPIFLVNPVRAEISRDSEQEGYLSMPILNRTEGKDSS